MQPKNDSTMMGHNQLDVPKEMGAWVLNDPDHIEIKKKPVPEPKDDEVLLKIDAVAICATDLEIISHGKPAQIEGQAPLKHLLLLEWKLLVKLLRSVLMFPNLKLEIELLLKSMRDVADAKCALKVGTLHV